jgi:uncharacterized protein (TIGR03435 family)
LKCTRSIALMLACLLPAAGAAVAQSPPPNSQFEVVSVKPNAGNGQQNLRVSPGRVAVTNVPLRTLIQFAYQVQPRELVDAPDWITTERFDITATADPNSSIEQMRVMLRGLLEDRFKMKVHKEKRDLPIYALTLARRDGQLGPKLHESAVDCGANGRQPLSATQDPATQDPSKRCLIVPLFNVGRFQGRGLHMENVASALNNVVDRTIVDKTGLTGPYEFELSWAPDSLQPTAAGPTSAPRADIGGPSLFTALQEQLGLKLEPQRGPIEILVLDHVERPTPD